MAGIPAEITSGSLHPERLARASAHQQIDMPQRPCVYVPHIAQLYSVGKVQHGLGDSEFIYLAGIVGVYLNAQLP